MVTFIIYLPEMTCAVLTPASQFRLLRSKIKLCIAMAHFQLLLSLETIISEEILTSFTYGASFPLTSCYRY